LREKDSVVNIAGCRSHAGLRFRLVAMRDYIRRGTARDCMVGVAFPKTG
jgi:hypothetical protein